MKKFLLFITGCIFILSVQSQNRRPCSTPEYRQFDFWIGEWEAFSPNGNKGGDSRISLMLDSCTILEEWTSAIVQRGFRFSGKSYNMYNAANKQWQQYWVDNTGNITKYFNGHYEEGKMIVQTDNEKVNDTAWLIQKMTFYKLTPDKIRQHGENSSDGGKTWITSFDLEYRRKMDNTIAIVDSVLKGMEDAYNKADYKGITNYYTENAKVVGRTTEISGRKEMIAYWEDFKRLGGTWKLSNIKSERIGDQIWQKGISVITDKEGKDHKVKFTLIFVQENGLWKILQDAYW
ncbi:MAG: nuclear transport factor 2 family protein [Ferruginibacter sp.]